MSKHQKLLINSSSQVDLFTALTMEAWLNPDVAADLKTDPKRTVGRFAKLHGYETPPDEAIVHFEVPSHPAGDFDLAITTPVMTATVDEYGCGTTAEPGCGSNNGSCNNPSYACPSISPSSCNTSSCLSAQMCSSDCPTYGSCAVSADCVTTGCTGSGSGCGV